MIENAKIEQFTFYCKFDFEYYWFWPLIFWENLIYVKFARS